MESIAKFLKVTIWVTNACNLRCKYCYEGLDKCCESMTLNTAEATIKWIKNTMLENGCSILVVRFHGGEPMLNFPLIKFFVKNLKGGKNFTVLYEMTTNGYDVSKEQIDYICKNIDELSVSMDGIKAVHDSYRININGEGTYDRVLHCARDIKKHGRGVVIRMTLNSKSAGLLYKSIESVVEKGFKEISVSINVFDTGWTVELVDKVEEQCQLVSKEFPEDKYTIRLPIGMQCSDIGTCHGGIDSFQILPNGDLYPCPYVTEPEYCLGNVFCGVNDKARDKVIQIQKMKVTACEGCGAYRGCTSVKCKFLNMKIRGAFCSPIPLNCELCRRSIAFSKS